MAAPVNTIDDLGGWSGVLARLIKGERLSVEESAAVMGDVLTGTADPACVGSMLTLLRSRGESVDELVGFSQAMLEAAVPIDGLAASTRSELIDTCGTGGDASGTINVSTMAALVVAAAGVTVCKHGNRAASSLTGSADLLDELGVATDLGPKGIVACIDEVNMGFCYAPRYHPAFRFVGPIRKALGVRTAFNFLGPLINPARVGRQVIGVSDPAFADLMLGVLKANGTARAMVVYGHDGLDELTTTTSSTIHELNNGEITRYDISPTDFGMALADPLTLKGGAPDANAERVRCVIGGEAGPQADIVALNAAASLLVGGAVASFGSGVEMAQEILRTSAAEATLEKLVEVSSRESALELD